MSDALFTIFKDKALAAMREVSMAVEFAEQARDAKALGAEEVIDRDSARNALEQVHFLIEEITGLLDGKEIA